jgi:hypothetical protein
LKDLSKESILLCSLTHDDGIPEAIVRGIVDDLISDDSDSDSEDSDSEDSDDSDSDSNDDSSLGADTTCAKEVTPLFWP